MPAGFLHQGGTAIHAHESASRDLVVTANAVTGMHGPVPAIRSPGSARNSLARWRQHSPSPWQRDPAAPPDAQRSRSAQRAPTRRYTLSGSKWMPQLVDACDTTHQNIAAVDISASEKASFRKSRKHLASKLAIVKRLFSRRTVFENVFLGSGRNLIPMAARRLNFLLSRKAANRRACGSNARPELHQNQEKTRLR